MLKRAGRYRLAEKSPSLFCVSDRSGCSDEFLSASRNIRTVYAGGSTLRRVGNARLGRYNRCDRRLLTCGESWARDCR